MSIHTQADVTAVILAGGMGKRMGGQDKGQIQFNGQPLIEFVLDAIRPQVATILINANRHQQDYALYNYPVISDELQDFQGPLAGFAAGLSASTTDYIVTVPCDGPVLASDLVARLIEALKRDAAEIAVAYDGKRMQPVYALIPKRLLPSLLQFLAEGDRKIDRWYAQHAIALADFSDEPQTFLNINTPDDCHRLQQEIVNV
jgi:molybdenum cofactor guanylyltransferase